MNMLQRLAEPRSGIQLGLFKSIQSWWKPLGASTNFGLAG